jgi:hypothetical protein
MQLPDGVTPAALAALNRSFVNIAARQHSDPGIVKTPAFLSGNAKESHRVFISTFIQHSTIAHLALGDMLAGRFGTFSKTDDWIRTRQKALPAYFGSGVKDFAFDYYAGTQALLAGVGSLTLYRGLPRDQSRMLFDDLARPGLQAYLFLNPLSSWSDTPELPTAFARRSGGAVVQFDLPTYLVFAYWLIDDLMEHVLRRQCQQHLQRPPEELGGEAIVWCPLRCMEVRQENVHSDFTELGPTGKL